MKTNFPKHITGIKDLSANAIEEIFSETKIQKEKLESGKVQEFLNGKSVINLFFENSTRTRISFEQAENLVGLKVTNFTPDSSSLSKGESVIDTIRNIDAMKFDYIVSRHSTPGFMNTLLKYSNARIINGGDGTHEHPTQALLDVFTLQEVFGKISGKRVCIVGDICHSRVAMSDILALKKIKAKVSVCGPKVFIPKGIDSFGVKVTYDIDEAIKNNDFLILLRVQLERDAGCSLPSLKEYRKYYGVNASRLSSNNNVVILHPGPFNKNVELDEDILDRENTLIFEQVTNGLAVKLALFKIMSEYKS